MTLLVPLASLLLACPAPGDSAASDDTATPADSGTGTDTDTPSVTDTDTDPPEPVDCEALAEGATTTFYETNPTYDDPVDHSGPWTAVTPDEAGVDGALLQQAADQLEGLPFIWSLLVLRGEQLVWEQYFHGAEAGHSNNVHSSSKSILGAVTGQAVARGLLTVDQPVAELLPTEFAEVDDAAKLDITVQHLLEMTSGLHWIEDATEYRLQDEDDWVQAIVDLPLKHTPGTVFNYATGNTHLLSAALAQATGQDLCQLAHEVLLTPLGLQAEHWGRDPQGVFSGGYNLYLTPRELLRFGMLMAQDGTWEGEPLLSASWVEDSLAERVPAGGAYHYGYLWWMRELGGHAVKIAWGYGGQLVYVVDELELVVVITTNTRDYAPDYDAEDLLTELIFPAF